MSRPRFSLRGLDSLPPHANAENHKRIMEKLKSMTQHEFFLSLVDAGIYTRSGRLTAKYAGASDLPHVLSAAQMGVSPQGKPTRAPRRTAAKTAQRKSTGAPHRKSAKDSRH